MTELEKFVLEYCFAYHDKERPAGTNKYFVIEIKSEEINTGNYRANPGKFDLRRIDEPKEIVLKKIEEQNFEVLGFTTGIPILRKKASII